MKVHSFSFNPFQENTYVLSVESGECAIIDPGMYTTNERENFLSYLQKEGLLPVLLINTHCHLDHIFGNRFCADTFRLGLHAHEADLVTLRSGETAAKLYGLHEMEASPEPEFFLQHGQIIELGDEELEVRFTPGHCPGHVVLVNHAEEFVVGGDVLFEGSVGRVDLPGGNAARLEQSIRSQLYTLPDQYVVYPGHGGPTTIGREKTGNYFVFEGGSRLLEGE